MKCNALIIDDNQSDIDLFVNMAEELLENTGHAFMFECANSFSKDLPFKAYMLYVLDIELSGAEDGFTAAKIIHQANPAAAVMFYTSHSELVFDSFDLNTYFFIRKDHLSEDLARAFHKLLSDDDLENYDCLIDGCSLRIPVSKLVYLVGIGSVLTLVLDDGKELLEKASVTSCMKRLPEGHFTQIDRNIIVNMKYIHQITDQEIILSSGKHIHVSRRRWKAVMQEYLRYKVR